MVAHIINSHTLEAEAGEPQFKDGLIYKASSMTGRATQGNHVSRGKKCEGREFMGMLIYCLQISKNTMPEI